MTDFVNTIISESELLRDIITKFAWHYAMVRREAMFKNGCILVCAVRLVT